VKYVEFLFKAIDFKKIFSTLNFFLFVKFMQLNLLICQFSGKEVALFVKKHFIEELK